jgi:hypothetical protein
MYGDFDTYTTEEEQISAAEEIVSTYLDDRNEWDEDVTSVVCGIITHRVPARRDAGKPKSETKKEIKK